VVLGIQLPLDYRIAAACAAGCPPQIITQPGSRPVTGARPQTKQSVLVGVICHPAPVPAVQKWQAYPPRSVFDQNSKLFCYITNNNLENLIFDQHIKQITRAKSAAGILSKVQTNPQVFDTLPMSFQG
jgi:hypothetical protein